jgi:predicted AlkP superfamily pyrophosphatase or phosphodiesterase
MPPVLFVMLDGVRPDAIEQANCPNIKALKARGSATMTAQSVTPSITLPCHTSIFHSVPPSRHGITSNDWHPMARPLPGLVDVLGNSAKTVAFFYNWEQLRDLNRPGSLAFSFFRNTAYDIDGDDEIAAEAARRVPVDRPDLAFLYLGTVDAVGHFCGWMSAEYLAQLERIDGLLGNVLAALPPDYSIIVHADHGGHDRYHGTELPEDMTIPWLAAGPNIKAGHTIQSPVTLLDTAPTIARLLGLPPHPQWEGKVIEEIFDSL